MGVTETKKLECYHHWVKHGFDGLEKRLAHCSGKSCHGDTVSLADVCLIPQGYNG